LSGAMGLVSFAANTCALMPQGEVRCWGYNGSGQLGNGTTDNSPRPTLVELEPGVPLKGALSIGLGGEHSCAVVEGGALRCWGDGGLGELGDGRFGDRDRPVVVEASAGTPLVGASVVALGSQHACALMPGGEIHCWGDNYYGQLGNGQTNDDPPLGSVAVELSPGAPLAGVEGLGLGSAHTCALASGGGVECWGSNDYGQLGNGSDVAELWPVTVERAPGVPLADVVSLVGGGAHNCALTAGGEVYCWGSNESGQLGDGSIFDQSRPVRVGLDDVTPLGGVVALDLGSEHSCALTAGGEAYCWGQNLFGQLGDGTTEGRRRPVRIDYAPGVPLQGLSAIAAGAHHTCAVRSGGEAYCWGQNDSGQLGSSEEAEQMLVPVRVESSPGVPLVGVTALDVGADHSCALMAGGEMQCWGSNTFGQLGNGRTGVRTRPGPVLLEEGNTRLKGVRTMAIGDDHSCVLTTEGQVYCWGSSQNGQAGTGSAIYDHVYPRLVFL
jgi:alpha-tubulin suppressor-like RCC1 family protein